MSLVEWFTAKSKVPPSFKEGISKNGKTTHIPNSSIRIAHGRLLQVLQKRYPWRWFTCATGGIKGKSVMNHILPHRKKRFFWKSDIWHFFPSVDLAKLSAIVCRDVLGLENCEEEFLHFLQDYCSIDGKGLAIGFPASPMLANIYLNVMVDQPLLRLIRERGYGLFFTHYIDDYLFSSPMHPIGEKKTKAIREVFEAAGLKLNDRKTCYFDLKKVECKEITGVMLRWPGKTGLPWEEIKKIRHLIHAAQKKNGQPGKQEEYSKLLEVIHGHMAWFYFVTGGAWTVQERRLQGMYKLLLGHVQLADSEFLNQD